MCDKPGDVCFYPIIFTQTLEKSKEMLLSILDLGARFDDLHLQLLQANVTQLGTTQGALLPLFSERFRRCFFGFLYGVRPRPCGT